jgi:hypothetical protein
VTYEDRYARVVDCFSTLERGQLLSIDRTRLLSLIRYMAEGDWDAGYDSCSDDRRKAVAAVTKTANPHLPK